MKKLLATMMAVCACLFAMISIISCDEEKTDYTGLMLLLAAGGGGDSGGPNIYLFEVNSAHNGDFDANDNGNAREELDALALAEYNDSHSTLGCTQIHAFISVSGSDEIRDLLPKGKPVYGPTGLLIANDKSDLLDGSIAMSLSAAGVSSAGHYWTGSIQNGSLQSHNCTSWTSSGNTYDQFDWAEYGNTSATDDNWIAEAQYSCINEFALLGVCW